MSSHCFFTNWVLNEGVRATATKERGHHVALRLPEPRRGRACAPAPQPSLSVAARPGAQRQRTALGALAFTGAPAPWAGAGAIPGAAAPFAPRAARKGAAAPCTHVAMRNSAASKPPHLLRIGRTSTSNTSGRSRSIICRGSLCNRLAQCVPSARRAWRAQVRLQTRGGGSSRRGPCVHLYLL